MQNGVDGQRRTHRLMASLANPSMQPTPCSENTLMTRHLRRTFLALLSLACLWALPAVAETWALTVTGLTLDGNAKATSAVLTVNEGGQNAEKTVKVGDTFPVGVVLITPARLIMTLKSSNTNEITLFPGSRLRVSSVSGRGEELALDEGMASFVVRKALDFFNVRHNKFQAIVRGTAYSVEVIPRKEITFTVKEGKVRVEREAKFFIEEGQKEGTVTFADTLKAGEQKSYRLDIDDYLERFKHFGEAETYYRKNLDADRASGDPEQIKQGLNQMGIMLQTLTRYAEAIPYYEECLGIVRRSAPEGVDNDTASVLNNLGVATSDLSGTANVQRAIAYYEEALTIRRQLFPNGVHKGIASVLSNLGVATSALGGTVNVQRAIAFAYVDRVIFLALARCIQATTDISS
ncbi:tetratricopeptide repeat protein [Propionivibrio sp.]|uniref:tetratricopeptide repeat protein n=1 Tax=Propionivibrio sp. TaxID=2212460 RepID=UPI003BF60B2F